ncbi:unnamed protein product, partial [Mesorhabditis spiculigera]
MGELETDEHLTQFNSSGRAGRRNAVPEIDISEVDPEAVQLAEKFGQLDPSDQPSSSKQNHPQKDPPTNEVPKEDA